MLVSIVGKARSGKSISGKYILYKLNQHTVRNTYRTIAFSDPLKDYLVQMFDLSREQLYGSLKEVEDRRYKKDNGYWTPREMMQLYGQCMRSMDNNIWVRLLMEKISRNTFINYIITDVRHISELEAVRDKHSVIIQIKRKFKARVHGESHESETNLDGYDINPDFLINNDSSIDDLHMNLDEAIKYINKGDYQYGN